MVRWIEEGPYSKRAINLQITSTVSNLYLFYIIAEITSFRVSESLSASKHGFLMAADPFSNSQTPSRRSRRACQSCRARKVKCEAASEGNSATKYCTSGVRRKSRNATDLERQLRRESKSCNRVPCSQSQEHDQEPQRTMIKGLESLLYLTTITPNERSLLSAFLPPAPKMHPLDLNAFMRGQNISNVHEQEALSSNASGSPKNDFDIFFDRVEGTDGEAELSRLQLSGNRDCEALRTYSSTLLNSN